MPDDIEKLVDERWGVIHADGECAVTGYREGLIEAVKLLRDHPVVCTEPGHAHVVASSLAHWHARKDRFLEGTDDGDSA